MDVKTAAVQNLRYGQYKKFLDEIKLATVNISDVSSYKKMAPDLSDDVKSFLDAMHGVAFRLNVSYNFNVFTYRPIEC